MRTRLALLAGMFIISGCRSEKLNEARQMPRLGPQPTVQLPAMLTVYVELDGVPLDPITHDGLAVIAPFYEKDGRRIWRLSQLVAATGDWSGRTVEAIDDKGVSIAIPFGIRPGDPEPMFVLNRRGDVLIALVDPADPSPDYHREGRRVERPGDPHPRMIGVRKIRISRPSSQTGAPQ